MTRPEAARAPDHAACIILARGGSKGIPGKNLCRIGGISLIARAIRAARSAPSVGAVYVSTDDGAIAAEARLHGARIIDRPSALADDASTSEAGWLHALGAIRPEMPQLNRLVLLQCTSPFTTGADIEACLDAMDRDGADCALSVSADHGFLWRLDADGRGCGVNHDPARQRQRRQDLPPTFRENGAIYCVDAAAFERTGLRFCGPPALAMTDHPPVEIDTPGDLRICGALDQAQGGGVPPAARLEAIKAIVTDFDGVHTANLVTTDQNGTESITTSRGDGMGLSMLRATGRWALLILSKERNPVALRRAEKLGLGAMIAVDDKVAALGDWLAAQGSGWDGLLYVGNDINDLGAMRRAGVSACPADAHPSVLAEADWILPQPGGQGALRSLCDTMLRGAES